MPDAEVLTFDHLASKLPTEALRSAAMEVRKMAGRYVILQDDKPTGFGWTAFRDAIVKLPDSYLEFDKLQQTSITNQTASVDEMAAKIVQFLADTFGINNESDQKGIRAQVSAAFENLEETYTSGWFSFRTEKHGSSWEYRIVFAVADPNSTDWFYSLVSTIKLTADIVEAKGWFGITTESRHNFGAEITVMGLTGNKNFRAPQLA